MRNQINQLEKKIQKLIDKTLAANNASEEEIDVALIYLGSRLGAMAIARRKDDQSRREEAFKMALEETIEAINKKLER